MNAMPERELIAPYQAMEDARKAMEEEEQMLREIIEATRNRPLDSDERAALYFHTGVRDE